MSDRVIAFYHHPCRDGAGSLYIANEYLPIRHPGATVNFVGLDYANGFADRVLKESEGATHIYFFDVAPVDSKSTNPTYPLVVMLNRDEVQKITILDHHPSATKELEKFPGDPKLELVLELYNQRSGTGLTWEFFRDGAPKPMWAQFIEALDLPQDKSHIPHDKKIHKMYSRKDLAHFSYYLDCLVLDTPQKIVCAFQTLVETPIEDILRMGKRIESHMQLRQIDMAKLAQVREIKTGDPENWFEGLKILLVPDANLMELGGESFFDYLRNNLPYAVIGTWYIDKQHDTVRVSLRSGNSDVKFQVNEIAEAIGRLSGKGGGGHDYSAVARTKTCDFESFFKKNWEETLKLRKHLAGKEKHFAQPAMAVA